MENRNKLFYEKIPPDKLRYEIEEGRSKFKKKSRDKQEIVNSSKKKIRSAASKLTKRP
jgi:hypothetical protein